MIQLTDLDGAPLFLDPDSIVAVSKDVPRKGPKRETPPDTLVHISSDWFWRVKETQDEVLQLMDESRERRR